MTWFKLDDNFPDNPKVVAAVEQAGLGIIGLFVSAGCYCSRQETDGRFPKSMASRFGGTKKLVDALVDHCLWHDLGDYYEIHDFLEYNPSKAELDSKRKAKSMAGAMGAAKRWASVSHDTRNAPDPTRPVKEENTLALVADPPPRKRGSRVPEPFEVSQEMQEWVTERFPDLDWQEATRGWMDHWRAQPGQKGVMLDWVATWRTGMRNAKKWGTA